MNNPSNPTPSGVIVGLKIENIQRLTAVEIAPSGTLVKICGNNAEGKSSILDAIAMAIGGADEISQRPIHDGADHGSVVLTLDDLVITRKFNRREDGTTSTSLTVAGKNGAKFPSPQAILDSLTGKLTFDPLEFMELNAGEQRDAVIKLCGIDTTKVDAEIKELVETRSAKARELKSLGAAKTLDHTIPKVERDVAALSSGLAEAIKSNSALVQLRSNKSQAEVCLARENAQEAGCRGLITSLEAQLTEARVCLAASLSAAVSLRANLDSADKDIANFKVIDTAGLSAQLANIGSDNAAIRAEIEKGRHNEEIAGRAHFLEALSTATDEKRKERIALISKAEFPLEGMSFDELGVVYCGQPLSQASDAQKIAISVAMGFSLNPTLKVLLIRRGALLDNRHLQVVADMAKQAGGQVWIELVGERDDCQIIIEDGKVKETA